MIELFNIYFFLNIIIKIKIILGKISYLLSKLIFIFLRFYKKNILSYLKKLKYILNKK